MRRLFFPLLCKRTYRLAGFRSHVSPAHGACLKRKVSRSSRSAEMLRYWFQAAVLLWLVPGCLGAAARLYTEMDPLVILSSSSLKPAVSNSSSAWLVQFYSSWCGHCIQYSSTWKTLAQDVKGTAANVPVLVPSPFRSVPLCSCINPFNVLTFSYFPVNRSNSAKC